MDISKVEQIRRDLPTMSHNDLEHAASELRAYVKERSGADLEDITHLQGSGLRDRLSIWCDDIVRATQATPADA
jgi:hypothetical protein